MRKPNFRPRRADDLGLRRALSDRLLPLLVAAMVFLAALALAGAVAAAGLARNWQGGAASLLTIQVPQPDTPPATGGGASRAEAVEAALAGTPALTVHRLGPSELGALLRPWLGGDAARLSLAMPAIFEVRQIGAANLQAGLAARLLQIAPETLVEDNGVWFSRLAALAHSLQACAALALLMVAFVAAAVVTVATRAGVAARRDAIEIVHGLGATDGMIARKFAGRVTLLVGVGAVFGLVLAIPLLLGLAGLTAPFQSLPSPNAPLPELPPALWILLPGLPPVAALIGWLTAQVTVRRWLRRLP